MERKFDTRVQYTRYKVLREVAKMAWKGTLTKKHDEISKIIVKDDEHKSRCCLYKERAIIDENVKLAMGGYKKNPNVIEVIKLACDECPKSGYEVSELCRGCIAHPCKDACKMGAITFDEHAKAHIDKSKCVNCGACANVCPYTAISRRTRPCENACKVGAIHKGVDGASEIDQDKCIACGSCVYHCPFGAIVDESYIIEVIDLIKKSNNGKNYNVYAVVAPSIAGQFSYAKLGQVITAIKKLGFNYVNEVALGADMVASVEAKEFASKRGLMTSSCCPAFVKYVKTNFPELSSKVSKTVSPMAMIGKYIKEQDENAKVIFIGPCTAKKMELQQRKVKKYIDSVITFEELQALIDSKDIDVTALEETTLDEASYFGRIFARTGGVSAAVEEAIIENNLDKKYNPIACSGIEECKVTLLKAKAHVLPNNFIEGMACKGGCINGAGCLSHAEKHTKEIDEHGKMASKKIVKIYDGK